MVQRYDLHVCGYPEVSETEGEWVKYEDYERLKQEFMDYVVLKEKQIANLERALGAGEVK